ncbi:unannotated protein [freshwater metagenome]|uniref:Unannotated protein n=1 Tax=freshwater metagenome TaxID=449393 RepID=A0A6J6LAT1_9ZZZZ
MPSWNPRRLRGGRALLVFVVPRNPLCIQRSFTNAVDRAASAWIAWKATCSSSAHACTTKSPPLHCASNASPLNAGRLMRLPGRLDASPNLSCSGVPKRDAPTPSVIVRAEGASPIASPGSLGRRVVVSDGPAGNPRVMREAARLHDSRSACSAARSGAVTSNAATTAWLGAGFAMPA